MTRLNFEVEQTDFIEENPDSQFATAKIRAFSSGLSRNDTHCSEGVLQSTASTIYNKPVLYNVNNVFDDFGSHADPEKSLIAGFVVPESANFVRLQDNRLSLEVFVKLWKRYSPKVMEIFKRDGGKKKVSVEVELLEAEEMANGVLDMKDFIYSGICLLGSLITEGSPDAQMQMLSFSEQNEAYQEAYNEEFNRELSIPDNVKDNINMGFSLLKKSKYKGNSVSVSNAKSLLSDGKTNLSMAKALNVLLNSDKFINVDKKEDSIDYIDYMLFGGDEGKAWISRILCYYKNFKNNIIEFPYKRIEDINPALKGIKPPITLGQANSIARQADAIGTDKDKNGWAIAISNFKKTHVVKDGKWVKKENMSMKKELTEDNALEKEELNMMEEENKEEMAEEKEEEKKEEMAEEKEEEEKEEDESVFSAYEFDADFLAIFEGEEDYIDNITSGVKEADFTKVCDALVKKIFEMKKSIEDLELFKEGVQKDRFEFEVNAVIKEIENTVIMPEGKLEELKAEAMEYGFDRLDEWKVKAKADAFSFAKKTEDDEKELHFANPWLNSNEEARQSVWKD